MAMTTIEINKREVLDEASLAMAYVGKNREGGSLYDNLMVATEDEVALERGMKTRCAICYSAMHPYTAGDWEYGETIKFELDLPEGMPTGTAEAVKAAIKEWLVCGAVYDWAQLVMPEIAEGWLARETAAQEMLSISLSKRHGALLRKAHPY